MPCAALPLPRGTVASPFGVRQLNGRSDLHTGVDVAAAEGTPVFAMLPGRVVVAAASGAISGYGNVVVLEHGPSAYSLYAHLSRIFAPVGQELAAGQTLGLVGRTAGTASDPTKQFDVSGAHLHFEFLNRWPPRGKDLDRIDPAPVLAELGIIVPQHGPLVLACRDTSQPPLERLELAPMRRSGTGAALILLAAAFALGHKQKQRAL